MARKSVEKADGPFIGVIKRHFPEKGYGFIRRVDDPDAEVQEEYFLHSSAAEPGMFDTWLAGTYVQFHGQMTEKGLRAVKVVEYDEPPTPEMVERATRGDRRDANRR